ncbi:ABC transporter ATP-binding protein [Acidisoma cellulosilytica]|uniref:ABC transporter ATP-binding protein n=1 Tax=Acidisoma cellulosilyticum TaxID=2802395 RepID=A0A963Z4T7_9PROT|nr:ABC transporter ATP-binding protein [Acidisoma cellulosilyticum]MCB8881922.1 ABC transporter ATP-binding protein [Acidisoma cellulosilyticum]
MAGAAIRLSGVTLSFGGILALKGVDLDIHAGDIHAIIGPNGAGKSSLVNIICGIYRPEAGSIDFDGQHLSRMETGRLAKLGITRTFQNIVLFKGMSVTQNVMMGLTHKTRSTPWGQIIGSARARREEAHAYEIARAILARLDLTQVQDRAVNTLSYGAQKRVELARALIAGPRLLLLDEPMAGMTAGEKVRMIAFIREAQAHSGVTVILIEHDMGVVMELSDRITVLDHGKRIAQGTPSEIQVNPDVIDAYLGVAHADDGDDAVLAA